MASLLDLYIRSNDYRPPSLDVDSILPPFTLGWRYCKTKDARNFKRDHDGNIFVSTSYIMRQLGWYPEQMRLLWYWFLRTPRIFWERMNLGVGKPLFVMEGERKTYVEIVAYEAFRCLYYDFANSKYCTVRTLQLPAPHYAKVSCRNRTHYSPLMEDKILYVYKTQWLSNLAPKQQTFGVYWRTYKELLYEAPLHD